MPERLSEEARDLLRGVRDEWHHSSIYFGQIPGGQARAAYEGDIADALTEALSTLDTAQARICDLHKRLSDGGFVEDGGTWEDRALTAEAEIERLREGIARFAEYVEAIPSDDDPSVQRLIDALSGWATALLSEHTTEEGERG